ncbi:hypothetical protein [Nakamurella sp. PAMC28650]|uniref:hypothetical protein n=1 Tax=Nakamurella sp. PAMC28650 TaxID=2762325 RepID=UPI00164E293A|nr:hypothetical protein [Nakamurella sp. PAMC28650]QNK81550.1 hypothetical protein H7F38_01505 [Nakamurella sp. PAMC28650]
MFNGTSWGPNVDVLTDEQYGAFSPVSCATVTFCLVVGHGGLSAIFDGTKSLGEYFVPGGETPLTLSCPAVGLCLAGGWQGQTYTFNTGSGWKKQQTFGSSTGYVSVSCSSATFCVAASSSGRTAVYRGATWTMAPAPPTAGPVVSVSCDALNSALVTFSWVV